MDLDRGDVLGEADGDGLVDTGGGLVVSDGTTGGDVSTEELAASLFVSET